MILLASTMEPSVVHSIVHGFFENKKSEMKTRVDQYLEQLFEQLESQVVTLLLPQFNADGPSVSAQNALEANTPKTSEDKKALRDPPKIVAIKSKPTLSRPLDRGLKRPDESHNPPGTTPKRPMHHVAFRAKLEPLLESEEEQPVNPVVGDQGQPMDISPQSDLPMYTDIGGDAPGTSQASTQPKNSGSNHKYTCTFPGCGKTFSKAFNLKRHERSHQNSKPYCCKWTDCSYASGNVSHTIRHIRKVHLKESNNPDGTEGTEQVDPKQYLEVVQELIN